ncbi:MAG: prephenate dehydratase [Candidatus Latescibacteria bacterium]|nr:prephenate dehydratase [Candidatus Latescibacterota bacterium]
MKKLTVAFQGELGAYSELAAREFFHANVEVAPRPVFEAVFAAVKSGKCQRGIIPIENSLAGSIHQNYDLLLRHRLHIVGEIKLRIVHTLIVNPGVKLSDVRSIYSHPQALAQCDRFIRGLKRARATPVYDTAGAVKMLKEEDIRDGAAIASAQAAADYGLKILKSGIESDHQNYTRFLILSKQKAPRAPHARTSIVFATRNVAGALFKSLSVFSLRDINLLKIESRPIQGRPWEYFFYLDFEGHAADPPCAKALDHLREIATSLRVLGSYEKGRDADGRIHKR